MLRPGPNALRLTLSARTVLAGLRADSGQVSTAVDDYEKILEESTSILGPDHPDTERSRAALARVRRAAD